MDTLALILAIIGAVNWGLVGFARFDLVAWIFRCPGIAFYLRLQRMMHSKLLPP